MSNEQQTEEKRDVLDVSSTESTSAHIVGSSAFSEEEIQSLGQSIIAAIKTVYDPEIPVDIYELGLIYKIDINDDRDVEVDMTLTAPGCPVAGDMPGWVENAIRSVEGIRDVKVGLVFDPPWSIDLMSDEAKLELNIL